MSTIKRTLMGLSVVFLLLMMIVPTLWPVHLEPLTSYWTEWIAGVMLLIAWGFAFLGTPEDMVLPRAIWPWLAWGLSLTLSVLTNHYDLWSPVIFAGIFWAAGLLALLVGAEFRERLGLERFLFILAVAMAILGVVESLFGLARYYGMLAWITPYLAHLNTSRLAGFFNYPTLTGFSLWLSLLALGYLFWRRYLGWVWFGLGALAIAIGIIATGNRSSLLYWFCLVVVCAIVAWRQFRQGDRESAKRMTAGALVITVAAGLAIPLFAEMDRTLGPYMEAHGYIHRTTQMDNLYSRKKGDFWGIRGSEFRKAIVMAKQSPVFGIGPGNYAYHSFLLDSKVKGAVREGTINTHSHNIFSMLLAENGLFGLLVFIVSSVLLIRWWWWLGPTPEAVFTGGILLDFFAFSNLEYPLWYLNFLVIFMLFCGIVSPGRRERLHSGYIKPLTAVVVLVAGGLLAWDGFIGFAAISGVPQNRIASADTARKLEHWFSSNLWAADAGVVFEQVTIPAKMDIPDQLSLADQVIEHFPSPPALLHKVMLLDFSGKHDQACAWAERAANSYPVIVESYHRIMYWYERSGQATPSMRALDPCFKKGKASWEAQWK